MNLNQEKKIILGFTLSAFLVLIIFYFSYQGFLKNQDSAKSINHTQELIKILEKTLVLSVDIETSQRGFAITGKENFLEPMNASLRRIYSCLDSLETLTSNNSAQNERVKELRKLINRKIKNSIKAVNLRKAGDEKAVFDMISSGRGREIMDSIRTKLDTMRENEVQQLNTRIKANREAVANFNIYLSLLLLVIIILIVAVYFLIRNYLDQLKESKEKLELLTQELTNQNNQLTEFAHIVSHNVRSPAANINSLINLIETDSPIEDYKMIFEKLETVSDNLGETLAELIDILQIKKDVNKERQLLKFDEIYNKAISNLEGQIILASAIVKADFSAAPEVFYPKVYLDSIFLNLISNSIKYRSPNRIPQINLRTELLGNQIVLKVSDNGLGIDLAKNGNKLFGLRKTFHRNADAKGLGLFMTKSQIEAMGGSIHCESKVDKGATFTIVFNKNQAL